MSMNRLHSIIHPQQYRQIAEHCGVIWQTVQKWRRVGRVAPEHVPAVAELLEVDPAVLNPDAYRLARRIVAASGDEVSR